MPQPSGLQRAETQHEEISMLHAALIGLIGHKIRAHVSMAFPTAT